MKREAREGWRRRREGERRKGGRIRGRERKCERWREGKGMELGREGGEKGEGEKGRGRRRRRERGRGNAVVTRMLTSNMSVKGVRLVWTRSEEKKATHHTHQC